MSASTVMMAISLVGIIIIAFLWDVVVRHKKEFERFEQLKNRECAIYKKIIAQWEQRLFRKTQEISQKWIKEWDERVKQWERDILGIKNPTQFFEASAPRPRMVEDICAQGYAETWFFYKMALKEELTFEHIERINNLLTSPNFRGFYLKAIRLMRKNGITLQKFVDPLTKKKRHKPTMLSLHWWLYVVDDMITAEYEQQQKDKASGLYEKLASMGIYWNDISKNTEYEEIKKILKSYHLLPEYEALLCCKMGLLLLLYDISSNYKAARETFIYYKKLIETVKAGYLSFSTDYFYSTIATKVNKYKERDKKKKKGLRIAKETPTFEEAYKLGVIEWMKVSNEKFDNQWVFWNGLIQIENAKKKLQIIFGDEKVEALEKVIKKDQKRLESEMREAILENKDFYYNQSREYLIQYLQ